MGNWLGKDYIKQDSTIKIPAKIEELRCDICGAVLLHREWEIIGKEWKLHNIKSQKAFRLGTATFESPELDEVDILICEDCYNRFLNYLKENIKW